MKIESMREFVVFAQYMSFTAAAKRLYMTQPALSYRVASMEKELGFKLVDREEPMRLTAPGKAFLAQAQDIVRRYDEALARCREVAAQQPETLAIEKPTGMLAVSTAFSQLVAAFARSEAGGADIAFTLSQHMSLVEALRRGRADAGVVFDPECFSYLDDAADAPGPGDLELAPIPVASVLDTNLHVWLPQGDPLLGRRRLALSDLDGRSLAFQGDPRFAVGRASMRALFERAGARVTFVAKPEEDDMDFLWDIAPGELVVSDSSLLSLQAQGASSLPGRTVRRIDDPRARVSPCLVWLAANDKPSLRRLVSFAGRFQPDEQPAATRARR